MDGSSDGIVGRFRPMVRQYFLKAGLYCLYFDESSDGIIVVFRLMFRPKLMSRLQSLIPNLGDSSDGPSVWFRLMFHLCISTIFLRLILIC